MEASDAVPAQCHHRQPDDQEHQRPFATYQHGDHRRQEQRRDHLDQYAEVGGR